MRLLRVRPTYFRGFGSSQWIQTDADLVVLYGPNGFGKTSLAEAIEWLFYGTTKRRQRGELLSKEDYQGSYRNVHAPAGTTTAVEAVVRVPNGGEYELRRELHPGPRGTEGSQILVNGSVADFATLQGTMDDVFSPVVAQDSLQDFIHSKPKERRDKIGAALGLDTLVRFKTAADKARTRFRQSPPVEVVTAQQAIPGIFRAAMSSPQAATVAARWQAGQFDYNQDILELEAAARGCIGIPQADRDPILTELGRRRRAAALRVFDDSPLRPPPDIDSLLASLQQYPQQWRSHVESLVASTNALSQAATTSYSNAQLRLWKEGLALRSIDAPNRCPLCEGDTLTGSKQAELQARIDASTGYSQAFELLKTECTKTAQFLRTLEQAAVKALPPCLTDEQRTRMCALFEGISHARFRTTRNENGGHIGYTVCATCLQRGRCFSGASSPRRSLA